MSLQNPTRNARERYTIQFKKKEENSSISTLLM